MTNRTGNAMCLPRKSVPAAKKARRIVLGASNLDAVSPILREIGWEVESAASGEDVRRLAVKLRAAVAVLEASAGNESGLLTCAKLVRALPRVRVVLIGPPDEETERFALFAGAAAYLPLGSSPSEVVRAIAGP